MTSRLDRIEAQQERIYDKSSRHYDDLRLLIDVARAAIPFLTNEHRLHTKHTHNLRHKLYPLLAEEEMGSLWETRPEQGNV